MPLIATASARSAQVEKNAVAEVPPASTNYNCKGCCSLDGGSTWGKLGGRSCGARLRGSVLACVCKSHKELSTYSPPRPRESPTSAGQVDVFGPRVLFLPLVFPFFPSVCRRKYVNKNFNLSPGIKSGKVLDWQPYVFPHFSCKDIFIFFLIFFIYSLCALTRTKRVRCHHRY